ncbi:MAG: O-antigen ligase family protein [Deltaproteobacteria bacterium]|nr:O-antigen ligase family protein [Deltaproteobacteria bacterium]
MAIFDRVVETIERYGLISVFLSVFLFFQPFQKFAGVRSTAFVLLLAAFAVKAAKRGLRIGFSDWTVIGMLLLAAVSVLSSALSPYAFDSFDAIRKSLLYQATVFFVILNEYRDLSGLRPALLSMLAGFAALTLAILLTRDANVLMNWLDYSNTVRRDPLLGGYSLFATFYVPLAFACLYASGEGVGVKAAMAIFICLESALSVLNNHRAQVVAIISAAILITLLARRYRTVAAIIIAALVAGAVLLQINPGSMDRYRTLLYAKTYVSNEHEALNNRLAIWKGASDMVRERPIVGWGYGWKKISTVAKERFLERWKEAPETYEYFNTSGYGGANPHNLALQILFEVGAVGLIAFVFFWSTILLKAVSVYGRAGASAAFLWCAIPGVLLSYAIINTTNGLWEEAMGNLMMAFAACCVVVYRQACASGHSERASGQQ